MGNPFGDLEWKRKKQKQDLTQRILKDLERTDQARGEQVILQQRQVEAARQQQHLVLTVLEQLRQAAYPRQKILPPFLVPAGQVEWSIGDWVYDPDGWTHKPVAFKQLVSVRLMFNEWGQPVGFRIWRKDRPELQMPLTRDGLVTGLKRLHS